MLALINGLVASDISERSSTKGLEFTTFIVMVDSRGQRTYVRVTCFDGAIASRSRTLKRGDAVACTGEIKLNCYEAEDGKSRHGLQLIASKMISLEGSGEQGRGVWQ